MIKTPVAYIQMQDYSSVQFLIASVAVELFDGLKILLLLTSLPVYSTQSEKV